uniref:Uncharacterized protein n=1 Tax=Avena sativa TaxID=4498 RepID=A0ACD5ZNL9_AVESA
MRIMANSSGRSSGEATDGSRNLPAGTLEEDASAGGKPYEPAMPDMAQPKSKAANTSALDHIMAKRKRREDINQRFIELSAVIPGGLNKMDDATILSEAIQHLKQLQDKVKALEAAGGSNSIGEMVVIVKKPCYGATGDDHSSPSPASSGSPAARKRNPLPAEIEVRFSEKGVMVIIFCDDTKGVAVRVLSEVEEGLHLRIIHANVMPFMASTVTITITTKASFHFSYPPVARIYIDINEFIYRDMLQQ